MKFSKVLLTLALCAIALPAMVAAANYAILVSGSNGFWNYRHHADIGHAYKILTSRGVPPENVITMVYNDVPTASQNPFRGKMFNAPSPAGKTSVDYWADIQIDYKGNEVTAANFINVLTGNTTSGGKVLKSGPNDNVFIYYSDHGSVGLVSMPVGPSLRVDMLKAALIEAKSKGLFNKLVFYLEACESGSMFQGWLPTDLGIYATTAANGVESSWGWYCSGDDAKVSGVPIGSCLGDEYSIVWMEDTDRTGVQQSLAQQWKTIKAGVTKSHAQQFGDLSFVDEPIGNFLGNKPLAQPVLPILSGATHPMYNTPAVPGIAVSSRDIKLDYLYKQYMNKDETDPAVTFKAGQELIEEIRHRLNEDIRYRQLVSSVVGQANVENVFVAESPVAAIDCGECCIAAHQIVESQCGGYSDYSLKYGRAIHNMCTSGIPGVAQKIHQKLRQICANPITV